MTAAAKPRPSFDLDFTEAQLDWADPEADWSDVIRKGIAEAVEPAELYWRLEDVGIGPYEYAGQRGNDIRYAAEVTSVLPDVHVHLPAPPSPVAARVPVDFPSASRVATVGGCDGDHPGRCHPACEEFEVALTWFPVSVEVDPETGAVTVNYEGEQE